MKWYNVNRKYESKAKGYKNGQMTIAPTDRPTDRPKTTFDVNGNDGKHSQSVCVILHNDNQIVC